MGDWIAIVAIGLFIGEHTDSGFVVAALWICLFGPSVAIAGFAGVLVDRVETTRQWRSSRSPEPWSPSLSPSPSG